jgi:predicted DNA-binding mobile mystery protein A
MRSKSEKSTLLRQQLDQQLSQLRGASSRPLKGWVRSVREALGMSGKQLAARLGVEPPRVTELEKAEVSGSLTLRSLQRAGEALNCDVVYALVPRTSLDTTVKKQAFKVAGNRIARVSHTMRLENQGLSVKDEGSLLQDKVEELVREMPRWLWDETEHDERV